MNHKALESGGLRELTATLRRRAWMIGLCVVLVAVAALAFSLVQTKKYTATASLLIAQERVGTSLAGNETAVEVSDPQRSWTLT